MIVKQQIGKMSNESEPESAKEETEWSQVEEVGDLSPTLEKFWEITLELLDEITEKVVTRQGECGRDETRKEVREGVRILQTIQMIISRLVYHINLITNLNEQNKKEDEAQENLIILVEGSTQRVFHETSALNEELGNVEKQVLNAMGTDAKDKSCYHCEKKSYVKSAQPDFSEIEKQLKEIMSALQVTAQAQKSKPNTEVQAGGSSQNVGRSGPEQKRCYNCGKTGHFRRQCWQRFQQPGRDRVGQGINGPNCKCENKYDCDYRGVAM